MKRWMRALVPVAIAAGTLVGCGLPAVNAPQEAGMKVQNWYGAGSLSPWGYGSLYNPYAALYNPWSYAGLYPGYSPYFSYTSPLLFGRDVLYRQLPSSSARLIAGTLAGGYALPNFVF